MRKFFVRLLAALISICSDALMKSKQKPQGKPGQGGSGMRPAPKGGSGGAPPKYHREFIPGFRNEDGTISETKVLRTHFEGAD